MSIVFHVGYPKAGSTTLQRSVFPLHTGINYFGISPRKNLSEMASADKTWHTQDSIQRIPKLIGELNNLLFKTDGLKFDSARAQDLYSQIVPAQSEQTSLFSSEAATGVVHSYPDLAEKARRIRCIFGQINILIVIREQSDILQSNYRDHPFDPRLPATGRPMNFNKWIETDVTRRWFRVTDSLFYGNVIGIYDALFGRENVHILPLELWQTDFALFTRNLAQALGVEHRELELLARDARVENAGITGRWNAYRRIRRLVPMRTLPNAGMLGTLKTPVNRWMSTGDKERIRLTEQTRERIRQLYSEDNRIVSDRIGIDLSRIGYCV